MTRASAGTSANITLEWVQRNEKLIRVNRAWRGDISENGAEQLLKGHSPFTYLLRAGDEKYLYYISFVQRDSSIKHQFFVLEFDQKGWCYRNAVTTTTPDFNELVPLMMHCDSALCIPLTDKKEALA